MPSTDGRRGRRRGRVRRQPTSAARARAPPARPARAPTTPASCLRRASMRITDKANGPGEDEDGTVVDTLLEMPVTCVGTAGVDDRSDCALNTTLDALIPGVVREGDRAIWQLGPGRRSGTRARTAPVTARAARRPAGTATRRRSCARESSCRSTRTTSSGAASGRRRVALYPLLQARQAAFVGALLAACRGSRGSSRAPRPPACVLPSSRSRSICFGRKLLHTVWATL